MELDYRIGNDLDLDRMISLYRDSTLAERRPVDDRQCMRAMLDNANLVLSAWAEGELVGIARSVTDFSYCAYLSDIAVHREFQRRGIGSALIRESLSRVRADGHAIVLVLGEPPYYGRFGFSSALAARLVTPYPGAEFQALELRPGALKDLDGARVEYSTPFLSLPE